MASLSSCDDLGVLGTKIKYDYCLWHTKITLKLIKKHKPTTINHKEKGGSRNKSAFCLVVKIYLDSESSLSTILSSPDSSTWIVQ